MNKTYIPFKINDKWRIHSILNSKQFEQIYDKIEFPISNTSIVEYNGEYGLIRLNDAFNEGEPQLVIGFQKNPINRLNGHLFLIDNTIYNNFGLPISPKFKDFYALSDRISINLELNTHHYAGSLNSTDYYLLNSSGSSIYFYFKSIYQYFNKFNLCVLNEFSYNERAELVLIDVNGNTIYQGFNSITNFSDSGIAIISKDYSSWDYSEDKYVYDIEYYIINIYGELLNEKKFREISFIEDTVISADNYIIRIENYKIQSIEINEKKLSGINFPYENNSNILFINRKTGDKVISLKAYDFFNESFFVIVDKLNSPISKTANKISFFTLGCTVYYIFIFENETILYNEKIEKLIELTDIDIQWSANKIYTSKRIEEKIIHSVYNEFFQKISEFIFSPYTKIRWLKNDFGIISTKEIPNTTKMGILDYKFNLTHIPKYDSIQTINNYFSVQISNKSNLIYEETLVLKNGDLFGICCLKNSFNTDCIYSDIKLLEKDKKLLFQTENNKVSFFDLISLSFFEPQFDSFLFFEEYFLGFLSSKVRIFDSNGLFSIYPNELDKVFHNGRSLFFNNRLLISENGFLKLIDNKGVTLFSIPDENFNSFEYLEDFFLCEFGYIDSLGVKYWNVGN